MNLTDTAALPPIAFVTPWYGPDIPGGAEALARTTAERLQQSGFNVEVWTTTLEHLHGDWNRNYHRPGLTHVNGVPVRRFAVKKRDRNAFDAINWRLMQGLSITAEEEHIFVQEMFKSPGLYEHIRQHGQQTILFFVGYMFASTYYGAQIHPQRSVIIPCLHDEAYARLSIFRPMLRNVRALLFNSEAEQQLARQLLGEAPSQIWRVVGMGIEDLSPRGDEAGNAERFRSKYGIDSPFVLYVGRREPGKNTPLLLDYWHNYVAHKQHDARLVLIGPGEVQVTPALAPYVLDLGFVTEQDKRDAYAAAAVLCQPSLHESFSIVLMESWRAGTPVLVHERCAVTLDHVQRSNGGLYFSSAEEFAATVDFLLDNHDINQILGRQGRHYVLQNFVWDVIIDKYRTLLYELEQLSPVPSVSKP